MRQHFWGAVYGLGVLLSAVGCGTSEAPAQPDSAAITAAAADSVAAAERIHATKLLHDAQGVMASLLTDSASAVFADLVVVQPPMVDDRVPPMAVCGTVNGSPGIGGRRTPTAFVYQSRWTVFVEEAANRDAFAKLRGELCDNPESRVITP